MIPHGREQARLLACQKNLGQIGVALAMYDQTERRLPLIVGLAALDDSSPERPAGPLRTLLEAMQLPDLTELKLGEPPPAAAARTGPDRDAGPRLRVSERSQRDRRIYSRRRSAIVRPRATRPTPATVPSLPAECSALAQVEAADGLSYTAAFSERLVGDQKPNHPAIGNYQAISGSGSHLAAARRRCDPAMWRGDAGSSWSWSDYRSTVYNHALAPNGQPSCVATRWSIGVHGCLERTPARRQSAHARWPRGRRQSQRSISRSGASWRRSTSPCRVDLRFRVSHRSAARIPATAGRFSLQRRPPPWI